MDIQALNFSLELVPCSVICSSFFPFMRRACVSMDHNIICTIRYIPLGTISRKIWYRRYKVQARFDFFFFMPFHPILRFNYEHDGELAPPSS